MSDSMSKITNHQQCSLTTQMTDTKAKDSEEFEISKTRMFVITCFKNQIKN